MIDESTIAHLKSLFDNAQTILIIYPPTANTDQKAVAASLFLSLLRSQKNARLVSTQPIKPEGEQIAGLENVQTDMGNQNLSMSFNYTPEQVDKVSYHIGEETGKFYLTIKPKAGFSPLDANSVEFSYTGASADLVVLVGVTSLESLEQLYFGYEDLYRDVAIISINSYTTSFGTVKLDTGEASTSSEVVAQMLELLGLPIDSDTATNLLFGIESGTQNLSSMSVSADTFERVAQLLRAGARRLFRRNGPTAQLQPANSAAQPPNPTQQPSQQSAQLAQQMQERAAALQEPKRKPLTDEEAGFVLREQPNQDRRNNKQNNQKQQNKKDKAAPPKEFTPVRRI